MKEFKIIATDVDGTLLNDNYLVGDENQEIINKYVKNNHYFIMNNGALPEDGKKILTQTTIGINEYTKWFIGVNGVVVYNFITDETFINVTDVEKNVVDKAMSYNGFSNYDIVQINEEKYLHYVIKDFKLWHETLFNIYSFLNEKNNKLTGFKNLITILNHFDNNKLSFKDIVFFGDSYNDEVVFDNNEITTVAVENAIPQLKEKADYITSTKNDGLYEFLK